MADALSQNLVTDWLVAHRGLAPAIVAEAALLAQQRRQRTEHILTGLGKVDDQTMAEAYAACLGLPLLQNQDRPETGLFKERVQTAFLVSNGVVPLAQDAQNLDLAMQDPLDDAAVKAMALYFNRQIRRHVATPKQIQEWIAALYQNDNKPADRALIPPAGPRHAETLRALQERASDAPAVQWVNDAIAQAVRASASDIHLEQQNRGLRHRVRVDGVLADKTPVAGDLGGSIISRIKILAGLDIAERRRPQDGRLHSVVDGREIDVRVSVVPAVHGECVVMRLLDRETAPLALASLGFAEGLSAQINTALANRHGLVLVTGPTGSGKTTTLYAALGEFDAAPQKIVTVEDPVEYQMEGLTQIRVRADIGVGFAENLRAVLRHDPDIILIGEIRDQETAEIAVQAALTGHLVLATLHTNDAVSAIPRLRDMGIEPYLIASTLRAVLAQRLARKLCVDCAAPEPDAITWFNRQPRPITWSATSHDFRQAAGCRQCGGRGFRGRTVIAECLSVTPALAQLIAEGRDTVALHRQALADGLQPLFDDGLTKAAAGVTSIAEVMRVSDHVTAGSTGDAFIRL